MSEKPPVSKMIRIALWSIPILVIAYFLTVTTGRIIRINEAADTQNHIMRGRDIYCALFDFATDHDGLFPCDETGPAATAEDCFNQLLTGGYLDSEEVFWNKKAAKSGVVSKLPPNNDGLLTANENAWGYVKGLSTSSRTNLPILFDSFIKPGEFSTSVWVGQGVIVKINGTTNAQQINCRGDSLNEDSSEKIRRLIEQNNDIFQDLPDGTKILPPQLTK